jgi:signal transduction histidine kinase/CheY-like chemotaxis protein
MAAKKKNAAASDKGKVPSVPEGVSGQAQHRLAAELVGIRESEKLVEAFLEQLPVGVALVDTDGVVRLSNEAFRRVVPGKIPSRDPEGVKRWRRWGPDGKLVEPANWPSSRALRGESVTPGMEFLFTESDGRETWHRVSSAPFHDASGAIAGAISVVEDIDNQKRAEEALRESESTLRSFYETAPLLMGLVEVPDDNSDIIHIYDNPATDRFFGRSRGSTVGQSALAMGAPKGVVRCWIENYRLAERQGKPVPFEYWHPRETGAVWLSAVVAKIGPGDSGRTRFSYAVADLTERKKVQARVEADLAALTRMHELSGKVLGTGGLQGLLQDVVDAAVDIVGADQGTLKLLEGESLRMLAQHGHQASFLKFFGLPEKVASASMEALRGGARIVVPDVEESPLFAGTESLAVLRVAGVRALQSTPMVSRSGKVLGVLSTQWGKPYRPDEHDLWRIDLLARQAADLIEQARAQEALRQSEEIVRQGVRVAGLGVLDHDHRSDRIEYSDESREIVGFGAEEEITIPGVLAHVVPEDREALGAAIRRAHDPAGNGRFEVEFRVARGGGQVRWVIARSQTFFEGEGSQRRPVRTIGALLDVTERKEFQSRLERLVAERTTKLQELVGELEHFTYTITHDLKSPLRAMKGFAEIASLLCGDRAPKEAKESLRKISTSAERMESLITDALNYSRSVRHELPLTDVDTGALLRGMLDSYPELQPSRAHVQVEGDLPVVLGNEAGLTQCFSNLLGNAAKFVQPGKKPLIRVWAEERDGWARIWVQDQGIGISKEMLPRVFDMFSRGSRDYEGTGIGLALVRKVTQRMGGRAGVESEEGKGSRFWIELRLGEARARPEKAEVAPAEPKGGTVLYVEDEESDAMFMKMAFAGKGLEPSLRVVCDGRAAIEYLSGAGKYADRNAYPLPSVVLVDLILPQLPGFEVLKWMRNHPDYAQTPVVVFSSSAREDDREKALKLGANEFVRKPNSGLKFGEVVDRLRERWLATAG